VKADLRAETVARLEHYFGLLLAWNRRSNLISRGDESRLIERHALDSLLVVPPIDELGGRSVLDLGSGGGLPGIPLKILRPELDVTLLDSRRMKTLFLLQAAGELGLSGLRVWRLRAERLGELPVAVAADDSPAVPASPTALASVGDLEGPEVRPEFDAVTVRAVAPLVEVAAWAAPLVVPGGHLIAYKGSRLDEELEGWRRRPGAWQLLDARLELRPQTHLVILRRS
jgi:16S rRNA (guanine527-N7)-methyltransferase